MVHKSNRPTVHDMRAMKARGQKISMLYVTTLEEAAAADAAGIHMLSIESRFFSPEMREAAGKCFVQVGLLRRLPAGTAQRRHARRGIRRFQGRYRPLTQGKPSC